VDLIEFNSEDQKVIRRCLSVFSDRDKKLGLFIVLTNIFLGILDLLGVIAIGLVGSLAFFGISSGKTNPNVENLFSNFGLVGLSFQAQAAILTLSACLLFISRTVLSMFLSRRILHFLSRRSALISSKLLGRIVHLPIYKIQKRSANEIIYILDSGVSAIALGIVGSILILTTDAVLLVVMFVGLLFVNPSVALTSFVAFSFIGIILFLSTQKRARRIGLANAEYTLLSNRLVFELFDNYREIFVKGKIEYYEERIFQSRKNLASSIAEQQFLPTIGKYVIESSVILLGLFVSAFQFLIYDAPTAISSLAIFLASGSRFAPLIMRLQQYAIQIKSSSGLANPALNMIDELQKEAGAWELTTREPLPKKKIGNPPREKFIPSVYLKDVEFAYENDKKWRLEIPLLEIPAGTQVAIVGPSGGGKSTLVDIVLGIIEPTKGEVIVSKVRAREAIRKWPGEIGYVPQKITAFKGSLLENITLGSSEQEIDLERVQEVVELSHLSWSANSSDMLKEQITDGGTNMSGGQLQRLGIARALYSNPKLIALDEATSALDGQTEAAISVAINSLKGKSTVLLIAHRLSSVRNADLVIYVENGKILATGTIFEVRERVPNFEQQAKLMGL
jgi:ABC-type bacteriocin/lantibiotic exporter with double-glycine peptidase domain